MKNLLTYLLGITACAFTLGAQDNSLAVRTQISLDTTGRRATVASNAYTKSMGRYFRLDIDKQAKIIEDHVIAGDYSKAAGYFMALAKSDTDGAKTNVTKAIGLMHEKLSHDARFVILMETPADWMAQMLLSLRYSGGNNPFAFLSPKNCEAYQPRKKNVVRGTFGVAETESTEADLTATQFFQMNVHACKPFGESVFYYEHRIKQYFWLMEAANAQYREAALRKVVAILEAILKICERYYCSGGMQAAVYEIFTTTRPEPKSIDIDAFKGTNATPENQAWLSKNGECTKSSDDGQCAQSYILTEKPGMISSGTCCKPAKNGTPPKHLLALEYTRMHEEAPSSLFVAIAPYISEDENPLFVDILSSWFSKNPKAVKELIQGHQETLCPLLVKDGADAFLEDALADIVFDECYEYSKNDIMHGFDIDIDAALDAFENEMLAIGG